MQQGKSRRNIEHLIESLKVQLEDEEEYDHEMIQQRDYTLRTLAALRRLHGFYEMDKAKHHSLWGAYTMSPLRHYQMNADRLQELSPGLIEESEAAAERNEPFLVTIEDYGFTQDVVLAMLNIAQIARITLILVPMPVMESEASLSPLMSPPQLQFNLQDTEGNDKPRSMLEGYRREKPSIDIDS